MYEVSAAFVIAYRRMAADVAMVPRNPKMSTGRRRNPTSRTGTSPHTRRNPMAKVRVRWMRWILAKAAGSVPVCLQLPALAGKL